MKKYKDVSGTSFEQKLINVQSLKEQYPIKLYGWEISPETEPNALAAGFKFKAVNDGDVKSGESVNELIQEIAEETEDYFWKATDGYKAEIQRLTRELGALKDKRQTDQFGEPINIYDLNQVAKLRKKSTH